MPYLSKRRFIIYVVTFSICLGLLVAQAFSLSLEQIISRRQSIRSYTAENISEQVLLEILELAYGTTNGHRSVPQIGDDYSLVIFPYNETGCYRYVSESNSLIVHDLTVNKNTVPAYDYYNQEYVSTASVILAVVWDQTKTDNGYFASAEAGCFVQNMYLAAITFDLGTCCVGSIHSEDLRDDLNLPSTLIPLLVMPLGYPENPYPPASPNYDYMTGNLPPVQYSSLSFEDAIRNIRSTQEWAARDLSLQELSQLLWAAYGYTNLTNWGSDRLYHKTTPGIYYELIIYVSNATGVYEYLDEVLPLHTPRHSIMEILHGDKRYYIADACAGQVWAADAPAIFLIAFNSSYNDGDTGDTMGQAIPHCFMEVSAGAVIQDLFLEASAWNLSANVVSESPEGWNGTGAQELRSILGLPPAVIPLYIVPVGARALGHDVAVVSVVPSSNQVNEGDLVNVTVVIQNNGIFTETFDVTAYANTSVIQTQTVFDLALGSQTTLTFIWNTTGVPYGVYTISANATQVPLETDTADNNYTDGTLAIVMLGDVIEPFGKISITDIVFIAIHFGSEKGEPPPPGKEPYNPNVDLNDDGRISITDVVTAALNFGETYPFP